MIHKVLIPLDGSAAAERAIAYLDSLPAREILLLRVSHAPYQAGFYGELPIPAEVCQAAEEGARGYLEEVGQKLDGRVCQKLVAQGDPAVEILTVAENEHCDLILMTSHGRTGLSRWLLGSVAERVARHAPCPVMIVGRPKKNDTPAPPLAAALPGVA